MRRGDSVIVGWHHPVLPLEFRLFFVLFLVFRMCFACVGCLQKLWNEKRENCLHKVELQRSVPSSVLGWEERRDAPWKRVIAKESHPSSTHHFVDVFAQSFQLQQHKKSIGDCFASLLDTPFQTRRLRPCSKKTMMRSFLFPGRVR